MDIMAVLHRRYGIAVSELAAIAVVAQIDEREVFLPQPGVLRAVMTARKAGKVAIVVHPDQQEEAAIVNGMTIYPAQQLEDLAHHLLGTQLLTPIIRDTRMILQESQATPGLDYADIIEDENAKHALEIAAIGHHHFVLYGDPRSGKGRLAQYLPSILPRLSPAQALEITLRHSDLGLLPPGQGLLAFPVVQVISPITDFEDLFQKLYLAHLGVVILQDIEEIPVAMLESIAQVLATKQVLWQGRQAHCAPLMVGLAATPHCPEVLSSYCDLYIEVPIIDPLDHLRFGDLESSVDIRARVEAARNLQARRYEEVEGVEYNRDLSADGVDQVVPLDQQSKLLMTVSMKNLGVDPKYSPQILRVARSITDRLGAGAIMHPWHVAEAVQYLKSK